MGLSAEQGDTAVMILHKYSSSNGVIIFFNFPLRNVLSPNILQSFKLNIILC